MSKLILSRSLLLEKLESRCLLAGGIFEHSPAPGSHSRERSLVEDRSADSVSIAEQKNGRTQHLQPRLDQFLNAQRHDPQNLAQPAQPPNPQSISDRLRFDPPRPNVALLQPGPSEPSPQSTMSFRPSTNGVESGSDNRPLPLGSTSGPETALALSSSPVVALTTTLATENVHELNAYEPTSAQGESALSTRYEQTNQPGQASAHASDQNREVIGGLVEILPLFLYEFDGHRNVPSELPWSLDVEALQQLRSTAYDTSDDTRGNYYATDLAIANWFGNSTGLIDDIQCVHDLPSNLQEFSPSIVDVVLDATVGLHRSVGLIGNGDIRRQPNSVRDSILAAMAAEHSLISAPMVEQVPTRLSGIAYPGAAIVVSTLALAGRHRRKFNPSRRNHRAKTLGT